MVSFSMNAENSILKPLILLGFAYLIYHVMMEKRSLAHFVPSNAFEIPKKLDEATWQKLNDKFGQLVQLVNTTPFAVAYKLDDMMGAFSTIINNMGIGKFILFLYVHSHNKHSLKEKYQIELYFVSLCKYSVNC